MGLQHELYRTANNLKGSGGAIADAVKNFSIKNMFQGGNIPVTPPGVIERSFLATMKGLVGWPFKAGLKTANWGAGVLAKPITWLAAAPGAMFRAFPNFSVVATVLGGAGLAGHWLAHRRTNAMMDQYAVAQEAAIQAAAAQEAANAQPQAPVSYKDSVTPVEAATLDAKLKQSGSHAAGIEAARNAAQAQPTTSVA